MTIQQIILKDSTRRLLESNGRIDAKAGKNSFDGWAEICRLLGWSPERCPAYEAYLDGYYSMVKP